MPRRKSVSPENSTGPSPVLTRNTTLPGVCPGVMERIKLEPSGGNARSIGEVAFDVAALAGGNAHERRLHGEHLVEEAVCFVDARRRPGPALERCGRAYVVDVRVRVHDRSHLRPSALQAGANVVEVAAWVDDDRGLGHGVEQDGGAVAGERPDRERFD